MKTRLLSLIFFFSLTAFSFAGVYTLSIENDSDLGAGWASSYDAATKTITYDGTNAWGGRGWWLDNDFSDYDNVIINFEPTEVATQLVIQYHDAEGNEINETQPISIGSTSVSKSINHEYSNKLKQIYIQGLEVKAGDRVVLTGAYITEKPVEGSAVEIPMNEWGHVDLSDLLKYDESNIVKLTLIVDNSESIVIGYGIAKILPINNYGAEGHPVECTAASDEGAENTYTFTIGQLLSFAKVDGEYYTENWGNQGITINTWGGAKRESLIVYIGKSDDADTSIAEIVSDEIISTEYYNLGGIRVPTPEKGFFIKKDIMSNGSCVIKKVYLVK